MNNDQFTLSEFFIEVGDGHSLYVQDWGNKKARSPIVFLHGGPGGGCKDKHKTGFDPKRQRVIFFDQRGSGRSLPHGSLKANTTKELVEDVEKIAKHLKLEKFILNGTSWGSSLALFYALKYPKRVKALVIGGVWTCSQAEIDWLDQGIFRTFFPDAWDEYLAQTPKSHHDDPSHYHFKHAFGKDESQARKSAFAYNNLEGAVVQLDDRTSVQNFDEFDPSSILIEMYYLKNRCFMPDRYILENAHKLKMPVYIVQGRYDMVCPPITAHQLCKALPSGEIFWTVSGHRAEHESWNMTRSILLQIAGDK